MIFLIIINPATITLGAYLASVSWPIIELVENYGRACPMVHLTLTYVAEVGVRSFYATLHHVKLAPWQDH